MALPETLIGRSPAMVEVYKEIGRVARTEMTVLLMGESGTGKELVARAVHANSTRARGPFVTVNMAALPRDLIESELYGHEKGSFTGAVERRPGKFELASGGTLFLDEIGELPIELQAKLLRVLQEREVDRVGGNRPLPVDVRIVAATNADLARSVEEGKFRRDLYYRLAVVPIRLPPLREREGDVLLLARHFIAKYGEQLKGRPVTLARDAEAMLLSHPWPGNVRELQNVIQRALLKLAGTRLTAREVLDLLPAGNGAERGVSGLVEAVAGRRRAGARPLPRGARLGGGAAPRRRAGTDRREPAPGGRAARDEPEHAPRADAGARDEVPLAGIRHSAEALFAKRNVPAAPTGYLSPPARQTPSAGTPAPGGCPEFEQRVSVFEAASRLCNACDPARRTDPPWHDPC